jgi:hypothetical protein
VNVVVLSLHSMLLEAFNACDKLWMFWYLKSYVKLFFGFSCSKVLVFGL